MTATAVLTAVGLEATFDDPIEGWDLEDMETLIRGFRSFLEICAVQPGDFHAVWRPGGSLDVSWPSKTGRIRVDSISYHSPLEITVSIHSLPAYLTAGTTSAIAIVTAAVRITENISALRSRMVSRADKKDGFKLRAAVRQILRKQLLAAHDGGSYTEAELEALEASMSWLIEDAATAVSQIQDVKVVGE